MSQLRNLQARLVWDADPGRKALEERLVSQAVPLAADCTCAWASSFRRKTALVVISTEDGEPVWGFGLESTTSRALPGYAILRVPKFRSDAPPGALQAGLRTLIAFARESQVLRIDIEVYCPKSNSPDDVSSLVTDLGFRLSAVPRRYQHTVMVDLTPSVDQILASFHPTGRRHIRAAKKHPVVVRQVNDSTLGLRMNELGGESFRRTGGSFSEEDWGAWISVATEHAHLASIVGMFELRDRGEEQLIAYAAAAVNGDVAEYRVAASTRSTSLKVPQLYAPTWELILWAKDQGAEIFDFGGVNLSGSAQAHACRGINEFKYYFSKQVVEVGSEYFFEPSGIRSAAASALRAAGAILGLREG